MTKGLENQVATTQHSGGRLAHGHTEHQNLRQASWCRRRVEREEVEDGPVLFPLCSPSPSTLLLPYELLPLSHNHLRVWQDEEEKGKWGALLKTCCDSVDPFCTVRAHNFKNIREKGQHTKPKLQCKTKVAYINPLVLTLLVNVMPASQPGRHTGTGTLEWQSNPAGEVRSWYSHAVHLSIAEGHENIKINTIIATVITITKQTKKL